MKKFVILCGISIFVFTGCGINPPTNDLELAKSMLTKAEEVNAKELAPDDYKEAEKKLAEGEKVMVPKKSTKNKDAQSLYQQAKIKAEEAYKKAGPVYADQNINEASETLQKAKNIKADVELKEEFQKAETLLNEAKQLKENQDFAGAGKKAKEAKQSLENILQITEERKLKAESSLNEAKQKLETLKQSIK